MSEKLNNAIALLKSENVEAVKSNKEGFAWFVPYPASELPADVAAGGDAQQEHGLHMTDEQLIKFSTEMKQNEKFCGGGQVMNEGGGVGKAKYKIGEIFGVHFDYMADDEFRTHEIGYIYPPNSEDEQLLDLTGEKINDWVYVDTDHATYATQKSIDEGKVSKIMPEKEVMKEGGTFNPMTATFYVKDEDGKELLKTKSVNKASDFFVANDDKNLSVIAIDANGNEKVIHPEVKYMPKEGEKMNQGGSTNAYEGKTVEQVWNEWTKDKRIHFIEDHYLCEKHLKKKRTADLQLVSYGNSLMKYVELKWEEIPDVPLKSSLDSALYNHIAHGSYHQGGAMPFFANPNAGFFIDELERVGATVERIDDYTIKADGHTLCRHNYLDLKYYLKND